jgi:hypothetical protein
MSACPSITARCRACGHATAVALDFTLPVAPPCDLCGEQMYLDHSTMRFPALEEEDD